MRITESLVVVKLGHDGEQAPVVFEVLEQAGLLGEISVQGVDMVEPGALGFRVPRERMDAVVLALECGGFVNVRAYEVQARTEPTERRGGGRAAGTQETTVDAGRRRSQ